MIVAPFWRRAALGLPGQLFGADFTTLSAGAASTLFGLSHTRGSSATVQTGTSTLYSSLGTDVAGVGRALDADPLGLVVEEARTNVQKWSQSFGNAVYNKWGGTVATGITSPDGTADADAYTWGSGSGDYGYETQYVLGGVDSSKAWSFYLFLKLASGAQNLRLSISDATTLTTNSGFIATDTTWQRIGMSFAAGVHTNTSDIGSGIFAGTTGNVYHLFAGQLEQGAFPTEYIPTTTTALTRSGARLWHPNAASLIDGGRMSLRMVLQAKGANADYVTDPYLWRIDANNHARIASATGIVTTTVGGSAHATASGVTWAKGDVLDIRLETGGGVNGRCRIGKNGGALTSIDSSPAAQGALSGSVVDLLQDGSAANSLSARLRSVEAYRIGRMA